MRAGRRLAQPSLEQVRAHHALQRSALPEPLRRLDPPPSLYPVEISQGLRDLAERLDGMQRATVGASV